jgi:hypothetical protein
MEPGGEPDIGREVQNAPENRDAARGGRKRGRPAGKPLSEAELAARRENIRKAHAAPRELTYRPTEKRQAASRANLEKALVARRTPEGNAAARMNALKHGLYARRVEASVERLGESGDEFAHHQELVAEFLHPRDESEQKLVRELAETLWRRERLFLAQAVWDRENLERLVKRAGPARELSPAETHYRAAQLASEIAQYGRTLDEASKLQSQVEWLLRELLRKRSNGTLEFKLLARRRDSTADWPQLTTEEVLDRLMMLSPARKEQILGSLERKAAEREKS